jgi:hypothetical protein
MRRASDAASARAPPAGHIHGMIRVLTDIARTPRDKARASAAAETRCVLLSTVLAHSLELLSPAGTFVGGANREPLRRRDSFSNALGLGAGRGDSRNRDTTFRHSHATIRDLSFFCLAFVARLAAAQAPRAAVEGQSSGGGGGEQPRRVGVGDPHLGGLSACWYSGLWGWADQRARCGAESAGRAGAGASARARRFGSRA